MIGNGKNLHHLIYIDDLIDGMLLAGHSDKAPGHTFLLAGKEPIATNEMVNSIANQLGTGLPKFRAPLLPFLILSILMEKSLQPFGIQPPLHRRRMDFFKKSFVLSTEKASRALGFSPQISFPQGVSKTAQWYTNNNLI